MICKEIDIWEGLTYHSEDVHDFRPILITYILNTSNEYNKNVRGAVLICPGGGYSFTSEREAEPIALKFNGKGYHAFVLSYSCTPAKYPQPLLDVSRAMCIIRENAKDWNIDSNNISVCGFSAGGHLAAHLGVHWNKDFLNNIDGISVGENKPNKLILAYPVITSGEFAHKGSIINLLGENYSDELLCEVSLEKQIGEHTPESFIWHTFEDNAVLVENSLLFANGLRKFNIPFELHIYNKGGHGLSLGTEETASPRMPIYPQISTWFDLCINWLNS